MYTDPDVRTAADYDTSQTLNYAGTNIPFAVVNPISVGLSVFGMGSEAMVGLFRGAGRISSQVAPQVLERASQLSINGERLAIHLKNLEANSQGGYKILENGVIRYYGKLREAKKEGEMIGGRIVKEFNPETGVTRAWNETLDAFKNIRQVRPQLEGKDKIHYVFDKAGKYVESWVTKK